MNERRLTALVDAVTDGEQVDWRSASGGLRSTRSRAVAHELRTLAEMGAVASEADPAEAFRLQLPTLLKAVSILAAAVAVTGFIGTASLPDLDTSGLLRLWIIAAFSGTGLLLSWGAQRRGAAALAGAYWCIAASFAVKGTAEIFHTLPVGGAAAVLDSLRPEAFLAAFFWQFAREFPAVTRFSRIDRIGALAFSASVALGIVLFIANLVPPIADSPRLTIASMPVNRLSGYGTGFWLLVFGATLPSLALLPLRARDAQPMERRRVAAFLFAIAAGIGPVVLAVLAEATVPAFARAMNDSAARELVGWLVYLPIIAMPVATAYIVTAHGVFRMRVAVRLGVGHLLARWIVVCGTVAALMILLIDVYNRSNEPIADVVASGRVRLLLAIVGGGMLLVLFRARLLRVLDRWVVPDAEDAGTMLRVLSEELKACRTSLELSLAFAHAAQRALQTTAELYVPGDHDRFAAVNDFAQSLPDASLIPMLVRGWGKPCVVEPAHGGSYYPLLSATDRQWIDWRRIGVIVALMDARGERIRSLVALQSRHNARPFSPDDLRFLATASSAVSLAGDAVEAKSQVRADDAPELASQCSGCRKIEAWHPERAPCGCGGSWTLAALPKVLFNRFELNTLLGSGGMGIVYRALDRVLQRPVAIKTLPRLSPFAAERLIVEARAMALLSHPHIAVLFGTETWRDTPLLVMEYLAGGTLASRLRDAALDCRVAVRMTIDLARALEYVHRAGWYHGDIKPSNIGFTDEGSPKFLDFGVSRAYAQAGAPAAGTLAYLSPEVLAGGAGGPALDLWALSVVLAESLTGVHPFLDGRRTPDRIAAGWDGAINSLDQNMRAPLRTLLEDALSAEPARRPGNAAEFVRRLEEVQ